MFGIDFEEITNSKGWDDAVSVAKVAIAANGRQPVGGMQLQPVVKTKAGVSPAGQRTTDAGESELSRMLQPIAAAYGAKYTNRELNKNPPYWLFALIGLGLTGLYIVVKR